jgi:hypothetical protein
MSAFPIRRLPNVSGAKLASVRSIRWLAFLGLSPLAGVLYMVINRLRRRLKELA